MKIDDKTEFFTKEQLLRQYPQGKDFESVKIAKQNLYERVNNIRDYMKGFVQSEVPLYGGTPLVVANEELLEIYDYNNYTLNISKLERLALGKLNSNFKIEVKEDNQIFISIKGINENKRQLLYRIASLHILHMANIINELKRNIVLNNVKSIFYCIRNLLENYSIYRATTYLEQPTDIIIYLLWQSDKSDLLSILNNINVNGSNNSTLFGEKLIYDYLPERGINLCEESKLGFYDWSKLIDHYDYALNDREKNVPIGFLIYRAHVGKQYEFLCELIHNSHPLSMKKTQSIDNIKKAISISKDVLKKYYDLIYKELNK